MTRSGGRHRRRLGPVATAATAGVLNRILVGAAAVLPAAAFALVAAIAADAADGAPGWNEIGQRASTSRAVGDSIVEPFFAFVLDRAELDSFGTWSGADVAAFGRDRGTPTRLPVERLLVLERRRPAVGSEGRHPGARVRAEWEITFDGPLDFPLPYSILGYHPGSLRMSRSILLAELAPEDLTLAWREKKRDVKRAVGAVRVFVCERGYLLLDADAMIDRLLGDLLDDSWTVGFVTARDGPDRVGLGVMLGRDGRPIYGEFDFARDRVEPHGRPLAAALAGSARRWLDPSRGGMPIPWLED